MTRGARPFAVLGDPVAHSRSPAMHDAALGMLGLPHRYFALRVEPSALPSALFGARALGFGGLNLTVPHKQAACGLVDRLAPSAERIGAVNTIVFEDGAMIGHNTDGVGFVAGLAELSTMLPRRAVVLGSGGAARAVVDALHHEASAEVRWVSRRPGGLPPGPWQPVAWDDVADAMAEADLLVNATTVGMHGGPSAFPRALPLADLHADARVVDLVYPRVPGGLLDQAEALGFAAQDGLPMLLWQGVRALEHWLGQSLGPSVVDAMRGAIGAPPVSEG